MLTIGKVAARAGISADSVRYYEREGLIAPVAKSEGGHRLYDEDAIRRIGFIKQAQQCGFTLSEILELLLLGSRDSACCGDVRKRAVEKKLQLEAKVRTLKMMSKALDALIAECAVEAHPVKECPILAALEQGAAEATGYPGRGLSTP